MNAQDPAAWHSGGSVSCAEFGCPKSTKQGNHDTVSLLLVMKFLSKSNLSDLFMFMIDLFEKDSFLFVKRALRPLLL